MTKRNAIEIILERKKEICELIEDVNKPWPKKIEDIVTDGRSYKELCTEMLEGHQKMVLEGKKYNLNEKLEEAKLDYWLCWSSQRDKSLTIKLDGREIYTLYKIVF